MATIGGQECRIVLSIALCVRDCDVDGTVGEDSCFQLYWPEGK